MRVMRLMVLLALALVVAACGTRGGNRNIPGRAGDETINWPEDPNHVVFRIDVVGGEDTVDKRNDIPLCAIYGDSRIVWRAPSQPGETIVLFDVLDPVTVRDFVLDLIRNEEIQSYGSLADAQPLGDEPPVYEQVILNVNDGVHVTDGFVDWPTGYFSRILDKCRNLSLSPASFEPAGGWMTAAYADDDPDATVIAWDAEATGINLAELVEAEQALWLDNDVLPVLWNIIVNSPRNRLFVQDGQHYIIALQVPNVQREAPPAPTAEELAAARTLTDAFEAIDEDEAAQ